MLNPRIQEHITSLSDFELVEYVTTGVRMYDPEPVAFAHEELARRNINLEQLTTFRRVARAEVARMDVRENPFIDATNDDAILCSACAREVPTRFALYRHNIGLLHARILRSDPGHFCRDCNRRHFWRHTLITLVTGWWGIESFFVNFVYIISNLVAYCRSLSLPSVSRSAAPPKLDDDAVARIEPHKAEICDLIDIIPNPDTVARRIAPLAAVAPGQVLLYIHTLRRELITASLPPLKRGPKVS